MRGYQIKIHVGSNERVIIHRLGKLLGYNSVSSSIRDLLMRSIGDNRLLPPRLDIDIDIDEINEHGQDIIIHNVIVSGDERRLICDVARASGLSINGWILTRLREILYYRVDRSPDIIVTGQYADYVRCGVVVRVD